jgi:DNA-binding CsgD family transcriptional regulator
MKSIEAVALGRAMIDRHLTPQVMRWIRDGRGAAPHSSLAGSSADDLRLLPRVAAGKTNKEIAQELTMERKMVLTRLQGGRMLGEIGWSLRRVPTFPTNGRNHPCDAPAMRRGRRPFP